MNATTTTLCGKPAAAAAAAGGLGWARQALLLLATFTVTSSSPSADKKNPTPTASAWDHRLSWTSTACCCLACGLPLMLLHWVAVPVSVAAMLALAHGGGDKRTDSAGPCSVPQLPWGAAMALALGVQFLPRSGALAPAVRAPPLPPLLATAALFVAAELVLLAAWCRAARGEGRPRWAQSTCASRAVDPGRC